MGLIVIDFEFYNSKEPQLELVCAAWRTKFKKFKMWLHDNKEAKEKLRNYLLANKGEEFLAFNATAEARSFMALGLNPLDFNWIDARLEFMNMMNCNNAYSYGRVISKGKEVETTPPPNSYWDENDEEDEQLKGSHSKSDTNLVSFVYKILGKKLDSDDKDDMRDLILSKGPYSCEDKTAILNYCFSDVENLDLAWDNFTTKLKMAGIRREEMLIRGRTSAIVAIIESNGYPLDVDAVKNFQSNLPHAKATLCENINSQLPAPLFRYQRKTGKYKLETKILQQYIEANFKKEWPKTPKGKYKTNEDTIGKFCADKYEYKEGNLLSQYKRYASFNTSTKSLDAGSGDRNLLTACGSDERVRAWLNPYGAQTSRFQPKSKEFLFLKSAWMRSLCKPKKGNVIIGIDFSSQEFLLSACVSNDQEMYNSYAAGDVYVDFGIKVGLIPKDYDKKKHKIERAVAKMVVLGVGYGMGPKACARNITDNAKPMSEEEAGKIIEQFYKLYNKFAAYKDATLLEYRKSKRLKLKDGWAIWGDNDNTKSILNFPIQGMGACILRKSLELAILRGLKVIMPLHDAIYIESPLKLGEDHADTLAACMREASGFYFDGEPKKWAESIGLDCEMWGPDLINSQSITKNGLQYTTSDLYRDERGAEEYEHFKQFFEPIADFEIARTV